jgi:hypothetical protein
MAGLALSYRSDRVLEPINELNLLFTHARSDQLCTPQQAEPVFPNTRLGCHNGEAVATLCYLLPYGGHT